MFENYLEFGIWIWGFIYAPLRARRSLRLIFLEEGLAISESVIEFVHPELNQRVEFFSGGYHFTEEGKLNFRGKEVLYLVGTAGIEASCCGTGGCAFIKVPGYIRAWKKGRNETGRPVSEVERVEAQDQQREIQDLLKEKHPGFSQIEFL